MSKSINHSSQEDAHADWLNNLTTNLIKKVNPNIHVRPVKNSKALVFSNISESDLANLNFFTNSDHNNNHGRVIGVSASIPGNNAPLPLAIPGFSQTMTKLFNDSDSQAFVNSERTHKPFHIPFHHNVSNNNLSVGEYIDTLTSLNPSLPQTSGVPKTYSLAFTPKSSHKHDMIGSDYYENGTHNLPVHGQSG